VLGGCAVTGGRSEEVEFYGGLLVRGGDGEGERGARGVGE
jgi:hypothetical protein